MEEDKDERTDRQEGLVDGENDRDLEKQGRKDEWREIGRGEVPSKSTQEGVCEEKARTVRIGESH